MTKSQILGSVFNSIHFSLNFMTFGEKEGGGGASNLGLVHKANFTWANLIRIKATHII